jgi:hypothetical protein
LERLRAKFIPTRSEAIGERLAKVQSEHGGSTHSLEPVSSPASMPSRLDRDQHIADLLKARPFLTSLEIAAKVQVSESTVRRSAAWKEHQARKGTGRHEKKIRTQVLTRAMRAAIPAKERDPADIAAEHEVIERDYRAGIDLETWTDHEREYLQTLDREGRREYRQASDEDKRHHVMTWSLTGM